MKFPDVTVRCVALQLLGKKAKIHARNLSAIVQNATEKSSKVRKGVIDVLGNYGKYNPSLIATILEHTNFEEIPVSTWKSLSLAWNTLIASTTESTSGQDADARRHSKIGDEEEKKRESS